MYFYINKYNIFIISSGPTLLATLGSGRARSKVKKARSDSGSSVSSGLGEAKPDPL